MSTAARRWLLLSVVLAVVGGFSAVALGATADDSPTGTADPSAPAATTTAAPAGSPAAASGSAGQDPRATSTEVVETEPPADVATDERPVAEDGDATVHISYADWTGASVEVAALVLDRVEDGGTCTLTLTSAGRSRETSAAASADVSTTVCPPLTVPAGDLGSGTWEAVVSYTSTDAEGSSAVVEVSVP